MKKNILLLTSDAVGGTLLKNVINVYANINKLEKINDIGHIELGINYNQSKNKIQSDEDLNYSQPWHEIIKVLESNDDFKIGKFSYYNLLPRQDLKEFSNLYDYINENFYIISCRRRNLFEHVISWGINNCSGFYNVFSHQSKIRNFSIFYKEKIKINPISIQKFLNNYKSYIDWVEEKFQIDRFYYYEDHFHKIEDYVLDFPMFDSCDNKITWHDHFGIDFNDWNRTHYLLSNLTDLYTQKNNFFVDFVERQNHDIDIDFVLESIEKNQSSLLSVYQIVSANHWPKLNSLEDFFNLPDIIKNECIECYNFQYYINEYFYYKGILEKKYSPDHHCKKIVDQEINLDYFLIENKNFLKKNSKKYFNSLKYFNDLAEKELCRGIPLKKQTLLDKTMIIENLSECIQIYNNWVEENNFGQKITINQIDDLIKKENQYWIRK